MATLYSSGPTTPDATETTAGKLQISTNAEALAGTDDTTAMTPLKVAAAISAGSSGVTGALVYRGSYDASTASPDLTTASKGDFYIVSVSGALDGVALSVGDHVVFSQDASSPVTSAMFDVIDNTDAVASVNGQTGVITLTASDVNALASGDNISELTNDSGYLTSAPVTSVNSLTGAVNLTAADVGALATGDNVSALVNDSGYLTSAPVTSVNTQTGAVSLTASDVGALATGDNVSELTNDSGYLTSTLSASIAVDTDGAYDIGTESARLGLTFSDLDGAVTFKASNASGAQITKGQPVYIAGVSGDVPAVALADADAAAMPCAGLAAETANSGAAIRIVSFGNLTDVDTSSFSLGDTLYIDTTAGALTATPPAGEAAKLQNIGRVIRVHATSGVIKVGGAGRSAVTPNLDQNKIFLGDTNNRAVSTALSAVALSSFNNDLGLATVATSGAYSDLSGTPTLGTAAAQDVGTSASNVVQLDGSARLPAVDGSQLTNLPSGATQLNDLSDVTITGAATGEVLRYSGAAWVDAQLAYSDLSGTPTLGTAAAQDVGTSASNVVQLDGSAKLPAVDGSQLTNLPSASAASETVAGVIEIATNAEATAGTATDKALVPSNVSSLSLTSSQVSGLATVATSGAYSDLSGTPTLGTAAAQDVGTSASNVVQLDGSARLPAVDGSQLTNLPSGATALNDLTDVTITGAATGEVLRYSGAAWVDAQLAYSDLSGTPTLGTAAALDAGTSASNVVQLDGSARLPAVDGSQLTNLPSSGGGFSYNAATSATNAAVGNHYSCGAGNQTFTVTLPAASGASGQVSIKNMGTGTITVGRTGGDTIDGVASDYTLSIQYSAITLISNGSNGWEIR